MLPARPTLLTRCAAKVSNATRVLPQRDCQNGTVPATSSYRWPAQPVLLLHRAARGIPMDLHLNYCPLQQPVQNTRKYTLMMMPLRNCLLMASFPCPDETVVWHTKYSILFSGINLCRYSPYQISRLIFALVNELSCKTPVLPVDCTLQFINIPRQKTPK